MTQYISHIDEANARVNTLETQLGLTQSEFIDNLDAANSRIQELEGKQSAPTPPVASTGELQTLNARAKSLAGFLGCYGKGESATIAAAKAEVAGLEQLLQQRGQARQQPAKPEPKPLPNDLAAVEKSGKVSGLGKAMIAATKQHNAQSK